MAANTTQTGGYRQSLPSHKHFAERIWPFYLPVSILWMELTLKVWVFQGFSFGEFFYTLLFSLALGFLLTLLCCIGRKFSGRLFMIFLILLFLLIGTQAVYYRIFKVFLVVSSVAQAGMVFGEDAFAQQAVIGTLNSWPALLSILLPLILWLLFRKRLMPRDELRGRARGLLFTGFVLLQFSATVIVMNSNAGLLTVREIYSMDGGYLPEKSVSYFGALTAMRLDIKNLLTPDNESLAVLGGPSAPAVSPTAAPTPGVSPTASPDKTDSVSPTQTPVVYQPNVMNIDFSGLIAHDTNSALKDMDTYFSSVQPTLQNQYTGMFKGKNIIWIVAESFSTWAIDKTLTPTLYALSHEGFVFKNYYNPIWHVSTSDGEFTALFGLLPKDGAHSMQQYTTNYYPFVFGKQLNTDQGYLTLAVHGGSYTYYDRDKSLPNMGYDFYAADHGITLINPTYWPTSDVELVDAVADKFIGQPQPFNVYYMTISGHQYYTFSGNMMSYKHENDVAGLPYSEGPRAYIACQMEFDQAVKDLIDRLTAAGEMDNTVLVISGDHYPYGLQDGQDISKLEELAGGPIDQDFELYHSTLIIWSGDMKEPIEVDKPCYSIDLLPTLSNLFGLPYDSRLLMGHDILSDSAPLVVFSNRSFITDKGRYNARTDTFTPADGADFGSQTPDDYAKQMLSQVQAMFKYSGAILDNDYYKHVLG